ncbi:Amidohydrolase [Candidatus Sulfopaludibacter sp. SbA3]|nr:Amidohydrolase [Candidatus Sulfopaludibacter sp. SbA3]
MRKLRPARRGLFLQGGTVHTISGKVIENGSVLIRNGKIVGVGQGLSAPEGFKTIDIRGQHVYPGMIDSASMLGLEAPSREETSDAQEIGLINPQLHAASAVNTSSEAIPITRANGVTSVVEMPEGTLLSGQMSLIHLDGSNNNGMTVLGPAAVHLRFPAIVTTQIPPYDADPDDDPAAAANVEPIPYAQAKQDYDEKMRTLLTFFARHYRQAKLAKSRDFQTDLRYEALLPVLDGTTPLFVTAVREREIREAIEFADKQKIKIILADAYESYNVLPLIKSHNIPVVLGPTRRLPLNPDDPEDRPFTIPGELYKAGIKFSIATFSASNSRNLPYQAATAVPYGLPEDEAYKAVSLNAAEIFGVANRLGSISEGKSADLIVTDGDPLDVRTHVNLMFIGGKPVNLDTHQKELYERYGGTVK